MTDRVIFHLAPESEFVPISGDVLVVLYSHLMPSGGVQVECSVLHDTARAAGDYDHAMQAAVQMKAFQRYFGDSSEDKK